MWRHSSGLFECTYKVAAGESAKRGQFGKTCVARQVVEESAGHAAFLKRREHSALRRGRRPYVTVVEPAIHPREMRDHRQEHVVGKECRGVLWSRQHRIECAGQVQHCLISVLNADGAVPYLDSGSLPLRGDLVEGG